MHRGYFKVYRKLTESEFWSMGLEHRGMWLTLLQKANHKPAFFMGHKIEAGQFAMSLEGLSSECKISLQQLRTMLHHYSKWGMIVTENVTNRFTKVTICNWELYNGSQQTEQQTGNIPTTNHQQQSENERMKECKKEQYTPLPPVGEVTGKVKTFKQWNMEDFTAECEKANIPEVLGISDYMDFFRYWSEPTPTGRLRVSTKPTWDTRLRMQNWARRSLSGNQSRQPILRIEPATDSKNYMEGFDESQRVTV